MSDWQPIETAPRDGTPVLCYLHYPDGTPWGHLVMTYDPHVRVGNSPPGSWSDGASTLYNLDDRDNLEIPTHWMPLPAPPEQKGE